MHSRCKACYPSADYALKKSYGLSREQYEVMWETQNGRCAICADVLIRPLPGKRAKRAGVACVDHNHTTGRIRGLLCYGCNSGIGFLKDSARVLTRAAEYLSLDNY